MAAEVKFTLQFRDLKVRQKLPSDTPLAELVSIAKDEFGEYGVDNPVIMYNDDGELLKVPKSRFTIEENAVLIVKTTDAKGKIIDDQPPEPPEPKKPKTEPEPPKPEPPEPEPPEPEPPKPSGTNPDVAVERWKDKIDAVQQSKPKAQGVAFIVGMYNAAGVKEDVQAMEKVFENDLGFAVFRETNMTPFELKTLVDAASRIKYGLKCKYIAFYYAGHGGTDNHGKSFVCPISGEKEYVYMEADIIRKLEYLKELCLLFMFDCCLSISGGAAANMPKGEFTVESMHKNSYVAYATTFGQKTRGNDKYGGNWTSTLVEKLHKAKDTEDFASIMEDVGHQVEKEHNQTSKRVSKLKKKVYLKATAKTGGVDPLEEIPNMQDLINILSSYTSKYDRIGRILGLDYDTRHDINVDNVQYYGNQKKLEAMLKEWQTRNPKAKWKDVIDAANRDNLMNLANEIEEFLKPAN